MIYSLYIINKAGGLVYQHNFGDGHPKLSVNDYLVLASTFQSVHAISTKLSPFASSTGIEELEAESFKLFCFQTATGTKFLLTTDPLQIGADTILKKIYELYCDFVLKSPFHTPEMPIKSDLFDQNLLKYVKTASA